MLSPKPWQLDKVLLFGAALLFCPALAAVVNDALRRWQISGFKHLEDSGSVLLATLSVQGAALPLMWLFLRLHRVNWRDAFGFRGPELKRALILAVRVVLVILPVAWSLLMVSALLLTKPGEEPQAQEAVKLIEEVTSPWLRIYLGALAVVLAPIVEEFVFRGVLYPFFKQRGLTLLAWIGVSILFALSHVNAITFVPLFVLALALTWLYEKTDNLLAPIVAHALFNAANLAWLVLARSGAASEP